MCFISYGLALKQPFQRFRIFTLTWERKGSPVSLDVFSNWVETKSEMLIINVCICILFICRCIHTTTSYGMFRKHPLATGRFGLCPTWCTQMFHLVCSMFKWNFSMYSCRYMRSSFWLHQSWQLKQPTHWTPMPCLEVLKLRIPSLMIVKAGVPVTRPRRFFRILLMTLLVDAWLANHCEPKGCSSDSKHGFVSSLGVWHCQGSNMMAWIWYRGCWGPQGPNPLVHSFGVVIAYWNNSCESCARPKLTPKPPKKNRR